MYCNNTVTNNSSYYNIVTIVKRKTQTTFKTLKISIMKTPLINANTMFYNDMINKSISINGKPTPMGYYNLLVSIRDCKLYSKGIKPHRNWKITDVKNYFGIKGNAIELYTQLEEIKNLLIVK